jgi:intron-binding protein aquarius
VCSTYANAYWCGCAGDDVLALPKLNLQFLTFYDYLLRSFHLFRLESAYEIRADIVDAVKRMAPRISSSYDRMGFPTTITAFTGWARMALPIAASTVTSVTPPRVGEEIPAQVTAEITVDLSKFAPQIRADWEALREHDVLFLLTIKSTVPQGSDPDTAWAKAVGGAATSSSRGDAEDFNFPQKHGVEFVRGCELVHVLDADRNIMGRDDPFDERTEKKSSASTSMKRTFRVHLDPAQYHLDVLAAAKGTFELPYGSFNMIMRRRPEENNFRSVLACIRDLINVTAGEHQRALPPWLVDVLLGYGRPDSAHYSKLTAEKGRGKSKSNKFTPEFDFCDTFLSGDHLRATFPGYDVSFHHEETGEALPSSAPLQPPFRVQFIGEQALKVVPYRPTVSGPYPEDVPRLNKLAFTPKQVEAIKSGMHAGLTLVIGPPGTGKTDTAVQLISNLYHNFPSERILIVTHSNQALNDLFEKISKRDIKEHHLVRLGAGEAELQEATSKDFSKYGRVNYALERRSVLLQEVQRLAVSLGIPGDVGYTCETAEYFELYHITSKIEVYRAKFRLPAPPSDGISDSPHGGYTASTPAGAINVSNLAAARLAYRKQLAEAVQSADAAQIAADFPFASFFSNAPGGLAAIFPGSSAMDNALGAEACIQHLAKLFAEIRGYKAFELLRTQRTRQDYMLIKQVRNDILLELCVIMSMLYVCFIVQARIVAMTCTHAAITRAHLVELGFKYDTLIMEEAAQVLEIETFIPMVLQQPREGESGGVIKRVVLIGDHNQLPPIIQNMALQKYSHFDQSMFARYVHPGAWSCCYPKVGVMVDCYYYKCLIAGWFDWGCPPFN